MTRFATRVTARQRDVAEQSPVPIDPFEKLVPVEVQLETSVEPGAPIVAVVGSIPEFERETATNFGHAIDDRDEATGTAYVRADGRVAVHGAPDPATACRRLTDVLERLADAGFCRSPTATDGRSFVDDHPVRIPEFTAKTYLGSRIDLNSLRSTPYVNTATDSIEQFPSGVVWPIDDASPSSNADRKSAPPRGSDQGEHLATAVVYSTGSMLLSGADSRSAILAALTHLLDTIPEECVISR